MVQRKVGIQDVAKRAGVSSATVSNALNHPERIRPARLAVIQQAIEDLGYIRSEPARYLRSGHSTMIGLLLLDAWNPGFMQMARGVEDATVQADWTVLIGNSGRDLVREAKYLRSFSEQHVAGLIITPRDGLAGTVNKIRSRGTPVVLLDRPETSPDEFSVSVDDYTGGCMAVQHLIQLGHQHIIFVGSTDAARPVDERFRGVQSGVADASHGVRLDQMSTALTIAGGYAAGQAIANLAHTARPTAIIAAVDMVAFGILQSLLQAAIMVPRDISLCGYDDTEFAEHLSVPLTTVRRPHYELGQSAAHMLLDLLDGRQPEIHHVRYPPELVIRSSTVSPQR